MGLKRQQHPCQFRLFEKNFPDYNETDGACQQKIKKNISVMIR